MWTWLAQRTLEDAGLIVALFLCCVVIVFLLPAGWSQLVAPVTELPRWVNAIFVLLLLAAVVGTFTLGVGIVRRPGTVNRVALQFGLASGIVAILGILAPSLGFAGLKGHSSWGINLAIAGLGLLPIGAAWSVWLRHRGATTSDA